MSDDTDGRKPRLSERERILLTNARDYAISTHSGEYYRLGGYGCVPIRFDRRTFCSLRDRGLVEDTQGYWKATQAGVEAL